MANDDRTEKATPRRRSDARRRGQVAKSTDLNGAVVLIAGLIAVSAFAPKVVNGVVGSMRSMFSLIATPNAVTSGAGLNGLFHTMLNTVLTTAAPIAGICMGTALLMNVAQVGWHPSMHGLKPDPRRLNPFNGIKNLISPRGAFEGAKAITKVTVMGFVVGMALLPALTQLGASVGVAPAALASLMASSARAIAIRAAIGYLLIGVVDVVWQRRRHTRMLRMTKQEVKDEARQHSLPPEVKGALRRRQLQAARARMMSAVPNADVVVTNPTHFAVALMYDGTRAAPEVVAKGQDLIALQIRRIAEENDVAVIEDPPLARSLHASVEVGQLVPEALWEAVAQMLAFVYRAAGRRRASA